mgnify:CR=1 FL=1
MEEVSCRCTAALLTAPPRPDTGAPPSPALEPLLWQLAGQGSSRDRLAVLERLGTAPLADDPRFLTLRSSSLPRATIACRISCMMPVLRPPSMILVSRPAVHTPPRQPAVSISCVFAPARAAVKAAKAALNGPWGQMTLQKRVELLEALVAEINNRFDEFLEGILGVAGIVQIGMCLEVVP